MLENVTFTLGASGDFFDADEEDTDDQDLDEDKLNPKFGITWNPLPGTTLRGAVFRTLKRTLITDQTLEPTQVAGFNQFFDDANATEAWVYGGAVDQKFTESIYVGASFFYRNLDVPFLTQPDPAVSNICVRSSELGRIRGPCLHLLDAPQMGGAQSGIRI